MAKTSPAASSDRIEIMIFLFEPLSSSLATRANPFNSSLFPPYPTRDLELYILHLSLPTKTIYTATQSSSLFSSVFISKELVLYKELSNPFLIMADISTRSPSFTPFLQLPQELQDAIWKAALPGPRNITISLDHFCFMLKGSGTPVVLHFCQPSRKFALITYKLVSAPHLTTRRCYFSFNKDLFLLGALQMPEGEPKAVLPVFEGTVSLEDNLKYLAVDSLFGYTNVGLTRYSKLKEATFCKHQFFWRRDLHWGLAMVPNVGEAESSKQITRLIEELIANAKVCHDVNFKLPKVRHLGFDSFIKTIDYRNC